MIEIIRAVRSIIPAAELTILSLPTHTHAHTHTHIHTYTHTHIYARAFGAPRGSTPMVRYYDSQLRSSLRLLLACRAFGTPKDNGVNAVIDIFLVASLEYRLI